MKNKLMLLTAILAVAIAQGASNELAKQDFRKTGNIASHEQFYAAHPGLEKYVELRRAKADMAPSYYVQDILTFSHQGRQADSDYRADQLKEHISNNP